jgi:chromosomal replication initiation ATPase DnaA
MISFRDRFHTVDVLLVDDIAREREEKEVVVLAITRVELIDSRKVLRLCFRCADYSHQHGKPRKPLYGPVKKAK